MYKSQKGFTLTELLIAAVLGVIVVTGALQLQANVQRHSLDMRSVTEMQQNLKFAVNSIKQGLSSAGYGLADTRTGFIAKPHKIQVQFVDEYGQFQCKGKETTLSFYTSHDTLWQQTGCSGTRAKVIATEIDTFGLSYYNRDGIATSNPDSVVSIEFALRVHHSYYVNDDATRATLGRIMLVNF